MPPEVHAGGDNPARVGHATGAAGQHAPRARRDGCMPAEVHAGGDILASVGHATDAAGQHAPC